MTLIANFVRDTFNLVVKINPAIAGSVVGDATYIRCETDSMAAIQAFPVSC
jgi:hypothetical protein